jgi:hypothetical protein
MYYYQQQIQLDESYWALFLSSSFVTILPSIIGGRNAEYHACINTSDR